MLTIAGIDAGFTATGLVAVGFELNRLRDRLEGGHVFASECIRTQRSAKKRGVRVADDDAERCQYLAREITAWLRAVQPHVIAVELPIGHGQGSRAVSAMGMATGTIASVLALGGYAVEWVSPNDAKKATTHLRNASKLHVEQAVRRCYEWADGTLPKTAALRGHICDAASAVVVAEQGQLARVARSMERGAG